MKIKNFVGKTYKEALDLVKREFGPEAIIMETKETKGDEYLVKITAAIDFDNNDLKINSKGNFASYLRDELVEDSQDTDLFLSDDIREELREIKNVLLEMKQRDNKHNNLFWNLLKKQGVKDEYIKELVSESDDENIIYEKMSSDIKAGYRLANGKTIMLIGPTGVGKTTTIIKLAAFSVKIGKRVGIINLDSFRLGAFEQIKVFCQLLGVPFCSINDITELSDVYTEFSKEKDIIFIDTTGRNPKDKKYINELTKIKEGNLPIEIHLTVSLSMQDDIFIRAKENYNSLGIDYLIFTKFDEAYKYGGMYNILKTYKKPVAYITNGQRIPIDIQAASSTKITNMILGRGIVQ